MAFSVPMRDEGVNAAFLAGQAWVEKRKIRQ